MGWAAMSYKKSILTFNCLQHSVVL